MAFKTGPKGLATSRESVSVLTPGARKRQAGDLESNGSETVGSDVDQKRRRTSRVGSTPSFATPTKRILRRNPERRARKQVSMPEGREVRDILPKENVGNESSAKEGLYIQIYEDATGEEAATKPPHSPGIPDESPEDDKDELLDDEQENVFSTTNADAFTDETTEDENKENVCPEPDISKATFSPCLGNAVEERREGLGEVTSRFSYANQSIRSATLWVVWVPPTMPNIVALRFLVASELCSHCVRNIVNIPTVE